MPFSKQFIFNLTEGLTLQNIEERNKYIAEKIDYFTDYVHYSNKEDWLNLFQEIITMCNNDYRTATFDTAALSNVIGFPNRTQKQMIDYYNIVLILGGIILNVFDRPMNRLKNVEDGISGAISTSNMFVRAYNEFKACKETEGLPPAYGATLIFATLFEKDIKSYVKRYYVNRFLFDLKVKVDAGLTTIQDVDADLYGYLLHNYEVVKEKDFHKIYDGVTATTVFLFNFLTKYHCFESSDTDMKKLIKNTLTLTPFLSSSLFTNIADNRFVAITELLFDPSGLNLRNNLAHCNFTYENFYSLQVTALLYGLFCMISNGNFLRAGGTD